MCSTHRHQPHAVHVNAWQTGHDHQARFTLNKLNFETQRSCLTAYIGYRYHHNARAYCTHDILGVVYFTLSLSLAFFLIFYFGVVVE